jgi:hypothetical protein
LLGQKRGGIGFGFLDCLGRLLNGFLRLPPRLLCRLLRGLVRVEHAHRISVPFDCLRKSLALRRTLGCDGA